MDLLADLFSRHEPGKVVLQLSFGKDSAACLWLTRPWWDKMTVAWCNAGNPVKAAVDYMEKVKETVPRFETVLGRQRQWVKENGYPTDILPAESTPFGRMTHMEEAIRLSFVGDCCRANMWEPMRQFVAARGFTAVIRGQKLADSLRTEVRSGDVIDGIEYCFPVEDWTDEEVFDYLGPEYTPPPYHEGVESSIDCANCTAYSSHRKGLQVYLDKHAPMTGAEVRFVRREIAKLAAKHILLLEEV